MVADADVTQDAAEAVVADALTYVEIICGLLFYFFAVVVEALAEAAAEVVAEAAVVAAETIAAG